MSHYIPSTRCTVEISAGHFCDAPRPPDMPFSICFKHAFKLFRHMQQMVEEVQEHAEDHMPVYAFMMDEMAERMNSKHHRVYYVRVGDLIKIGTTRNLKNRVRSYPPGAELLAVERGGERIEGRRHRQFQHLLAHRKEWFHPGPDLMAHIAKLSALEQVGSSPGS